MPRAGTGASVTKTRGQQDHRPAEEQRAPIGRPVSPRALACAPRHEEPPGRGHSHPWRRRTLVAEPIVRTGRVQRSVTRYRSQRPRRIWIQRVRVERAPSRFIRPEFAPAWRARSGYAGQRLRPPVRFRLPRLVRPGSLRAAPRQRHPRHPFFFNFFRAAFFDPVFLNADDVFLNADDRFGKLRPIFIQLVIQPPPHRHRGLHHRLYRRRFVRQLAARGLASIRATTVWLEWPIRQLQPPGRRHPVRHGRPRQHTQLPRAGRRASPFRIVRNPADEFLGPLGTSGTIGITSCARLRCRLGRVLVWFLAVCPLHPRRHGRVDDLLRHDLIVRPDRLPARAGNCPVQPDDPIHPNRGRHLLRVPRWCAVEARHSVQQ